MENPIARYLQDAIAAEKSFETQLRGFAKEAPNAAIRALFETHAEETRKQYEDLTSRLKQLGETPSSIKSFLAHFFNLTPKAAQIGYEKEERTVQDLFMAYSVENAEVAMYESLISASEANGDTETAWLARQIQTQEKETADKVWRQITPAARETMNAGDSSTRDKLLEYLEGAEAAERTFEDALASFSKEGDREDVKRMLSSMSQKARTQHERLRMRLEALGGSPSAAKSAMAHMLAFTPASAQMGHEPSEKNTQHLMMVYAAAAAEMAMYEALAAVSQAAGDEQTASLARELQREEKEDHEQAWNRLRETARDSFREVVSKS